MVLNRDREQEKNNQQDNNADRSKMAKVGNGSPVGRELHLESMQEELSVHNEELSQLGLNKKARRRNRAFS